MKKLLLILLLSVVGNTTLNAQTMTFGAGASEPGFSFSGWTAAAGTIWIANLANPATVSINTGTWNFTSFTVGPYVGNNDMQVTSNLGNSYTYNTSSTGTHTLNWVGVTTVTFVRTSGSGASADHDNFVYSVTPPCNDPDVPTAIVASANNICPGTSSTISWTGALNDATNWHIYSTSCGTGQIATTSSNSLVVNPTVTTTYYIRGEDGAGCVNESSGLCGQITVVVDQTPSTLTSATAGNTAICEGSTVSLTANGLSLGSAATLNWFTGSGGTGTNVGTGSPISVSPTATTIYYAYINGTCNTIEQSVSITVNPLPAVTASGSASICDGQSATITANGASTYVWDNGAGTGATVSVSPNTTTTYSVTGTSANNCSNTAQVIVTVNPLPDVTVAVSNNILIANNTSAGLTFQWLNCPSMTVINGATNQTFTPTTSGDYAVIVTNTSCTDTSTCYSINGVGIIENNFNTELQVYPNPIENDFSISFGEKHSEVQITISDLNGRLIQQKTIAESQFVNLRLDEPAGIYLVKITSEDKQAVIRLMKK